MNGVRPERTGWRDQALSERHRMWGTDCPAVDLDFLLLEFDTAKAAAIIEYKSEFADIQPLSNPSYRAISGLGTDAGIPVFEVRYAADFSWFEVTPLNAKPHESRRTVKLTEPDYVKFLYKIRGRDVPRDILEWMTRSYGNRSRTTR